MALARAVTVRVVRRVVESLADSACRRECTFKLDRFESGAFRVSLNTCYGHDQCIWREFALVEDDDDDQT